MARDPRTYRAARRNNWRASWAEPPMSSPKMSKFKKIIVGLGGPATTIAIILASLGPAGILNMATVYVMLVGAWIVGTLTIIRSEWLWEFPAKHRIAAGILGSTMLGGFILIIGLWERDTNYELTHLVAGNEPMPTSVPCVKPAQDKLVVFLGDKFAVTPVADFPHTVISMGRDRQSKPLPVLVIDKNDRGISIKKLLLYGERGTTITSIDDDAPWHNSNFRVTKVNPHRLIARDEQDQEILDLEFLNQHAIRLTGVFRHPRMLPLAIKSDIIIAGNVRMIDGACFKGHLSVDGPPLF